MRQKDPGELAGLEKFRIGSNIVWN